MSESHFFKDLFCSCLCTISPKEKISYIPTTSPKPPPFIWCPEAWSVTSIWLRHSLARPKKTGMPRSGNPQTVLLRSIILQAVAIFSSLAPAKYAATALQRHHPAPVWTLYLKAALRDSMLLYHFKQQANPEFNIPWIQILVHTLFKSVHFCLFQK